MSEKPTDLRQALIAVLEADAAWRASSSVEFDDPLQDALSQARELVEAEQPIETAPKDGSSVYLPLGGKVAAYWCDDLERWVLVRPLHIESIAEPATWLPAEGVKS